MKRVILVLGSLVIALSMNAQNIYTHTKVLQMENSPVLHKYITVDQTTPEASKEQVVNPKINSSSGNGSRGQVGTVIGHTTYDLQSNSSDPQRLVMGAGGKIAATWTGSTEMTNTWSDRGSFYCFYDGSNWDAEPTSAIETQRTGWPTNIVTASGKEVIFSHNPATGKYYLIIMTRNTMGTGSWTEANSGFSGIWPRMAQGGANGESLHLINAFYDGNPTTNLFTKYFRSVDGGTTWNINGVSLVGVDTPGGYNTMGGDAYAIDCRGDIVAIASGNSNNPWGIWKSTDNGTTFTRTAAMIHPIPNMDGTKITDIDGDFIADIISVTDASHTILIDKSGMVHAWAGYMRVTDDDPAAGSGWSYYPGTNGLLYWNETYGVDSVDTLTGALDLDNSLTLDIGVNVPGYGVSLSSMPTAAVDTITGHIYLVYSAAVENTDYFGDPSNPDAQSFRDLYGMYTTDQGQTWSPAVNLTKGAVFQYENVYPTAARIANGKVHVTWMRDEEPGTALENTPDPVSENEIVYMGFDYNDFEPSAPIAKFGYTIIIGPTVQFNDSSINGNLWLWDFDDGTISTQQSPLKTYANGGTYDVCLTVTNQFGADTTCKTLTVSGILEQDFRSFFTVYPVPTNGILYVDINTNFKFKFELSIYNLLGSEVKRIEGLDANSANTMELNLSDLDVGVYLLKIKSENSTYTKKITIIN